MRLVIVTGMSGAGKTIALKMLEDMGFYCVDNLPILLVEQFAELLLQAPQQRENVAIGLDIRSGNELPQLGNILHKWKQQGIAHEILFLDANKDTLVKRYKETRRSHPLAGKGRVEQAIDEEIDLLSFLKQEANYILDTSRLLTKELRQELERIFDQNQEFQNLVITVLSFGFKYGIPTDADLVFDVRFLPNPHYDLNLRPCTGEIEAVQQYVKQGGTADAFLKKLYDMFEFLIPNYILEGKNQLVIGIGCTGGKHRSVTIANELYRELSKKDSFVVKIEHRDMEKDGKICHFPQK